nr:hypothetical protein [Tanacetum cinerariifolium]
MAIDYAAGGRLRKLRPKEAWETIEDLPQYEEEKWNEPIFSKKGSLDYIDANLEHELDSIERRVESLMRSEVLLYYEWGFTSPKRPYQEEFKGYDKNGTKSEQNQAKSRETESVGKSEIKPDKVKAQSKPRKHYMEENTNFRAKIGKP